MNEADKHLHFYRSLPGKTIREDLGHIFGHSIPVLTWRI